MHDGQFFAEHVKGKRPRAPVERRVHRRGGTNIVDPSQWYEETAAMMLTAQQAEQLAQAQAQGMAQAEQLAQAQGIPTSLGGAPGMAAHLY